MILPTRATITKKGVFSHDSESLGTFLERRVKARKSGKFAILRYAPILPPKGQGSYITTFSARTSMIEIKSETIKAFMTIGVGRSQASVTSINANQNGTSGMIEQGIEAF